MFLFFRLLLALSLCTTWLGAARAEAPPRVGLAIIKTSQAAVSEALLVPGGRLGHKINSNFSAFLIKHQDDYLLFDTGMGRQIDAQYALDMPWWWRAFFRYERPVRSAREQLDAAGLAPPARIILSHSHWDHAGGIGDFPEARVGIAAAELPRIEQPTQGPGGSWASQLRATPVHWESLSFEPRPYKGFAQSLDLYGDGSVVLVPMAGHTPGSIGLFVTTDAGRSYFLIGDVAWTLAALQQARPKFWLASWLVDGDAAQTQASLEQVRALMQAEPQLVVVPAHDSAVQDALGYFPAWVR